MTDHQGHGWIQTFTGRAFWPLDPRVDDIDILDIAHALSMLCRYGGHTRRFYSVAEHCVLMSRYVEPENALWALLHDATEAYMVDVPRPIKRQLPDYMAAEDNLMGHICKRYDLDPVCPKAVKHADNRILHDERAELMATAPMRRSTDGDTEPLGVTITGWLPSAAEVFYLRRFHELVS